MNTFKLKDPIPEIAAEPAAPSMPPPALPVLPQTATPQITPPQLRPAPSGLAAAGFGGVIGQVDVLSEAEEQRFGVCEGAIQAGCQSIVEVGLALGEIRDGRLYRNNFSSFEEYCQRRWEFKRGKAHYLISAARICRQIAQTPGLAQPDRESQLRPLLAVNLEDAELAWQYAAQFSSGRPITARMVKRAVKVLHLPLVNVRPAPPLGRQSKHELRRIVFGTMEEMLGLITQKADHSRLLERFEALHGQLQVLFKPRKPRNS
jgi:hypothetical protein